MPNFVKNVYSQDSQEISYWWRLDLFATDSTAKNLQRLQSRVMRNAIGICLEISMVADGCNQPDGRFWQIPERDEQLFWRFP
jgi:hypothetical protein